MAALTSLYSSIRLYAQQCPDTTIDKYAIEAIREFCRESGYYQQTITINQVDGTASYTVTPANSEETISIETVQQEDSNLPPLELDDLTGGREPTGYLFSPPSTLTISPTPTESVTGGLEVRAVVMPPEGTATIPDSIYRNYKETIVAGALSKILMMQSEPWSNPELASLMLRNYYLGIFAAKGQAMRGFKRGNLSVKPRYFAI